MAKKRCPVCKKVLTDKEFDRALGILQTREKHLHSERAKLEEKLNRERAAVQKKLAAARERAVEARAEGVAAERAKTERLVRGKDRKIENLKQMMKNLKKGTTPQTDGLEDEEVLVRRLRREYPSDEVLRKGQGGDVLHHVYHNHEQAGTIVYECKRMDRISSSHVRQAMLAKESRNADFAVLVTTGQRKKFAGFARDGDVFIVAPLGVISLASLLRNFLIEMVRAKVTKEKRAAVAAELMGFVTGPQFKNPIETVIQRTGELQAMVVEEARTHLRTWEKRLNAYQTISWDSMQIRTNVRLVLDGKKTKTLGRPKQIRFPRFQARLLLPETGASRAP